jgi:hypothetical protein
VHQRRLVRGIEGGPAGDQVVHHRGQRVLIGARVEVGAVELLGRHVGQRAHAEHLRALGVEVERAAEVGDLHVAHAAAFDAGQQVGRLHVAVDQPLAVHVAQGHRALEPELDDLLQRQQRVGPAVLAQRRTRHVLEHEVRLQRVVDRVVELHDVGMLEAADQRRLGGEKARAEVRFHRIGQRRAAHALDRDHAIVELIARQEHLAGGAFAQPRAHLIAPDALRQHSRHDGAAFGCHLGR